MKTTTIMGVGLVGFALLAVLTILLAGGWIEKDLAERSRAELEAVGQSWANVEMSGRDAALTGDAPDATSAEQAMVTVSKVRGVRGVEDRMNKL